jgi:hypothetical protein
MIVVVVKERLLPAIAAQGEMMRHTGFHDAGDSGHGGRIIKDLFESRIE